MKALINKKIKIFTLVTAAAIVLAGCGTNAQNVKNTARFKSAGRI